MHCLKCTRPPIAFIRYSGAHLCKEHFCAWVERRVKRSLRKQWVDKEDKIGIALSGGKDSTLALWLLHHILGKRNELVAITVDEGIAGYRDKSIEAARASCKQLDIPQHLIEFNEEIGLTMDEVAERGSTLTPCTYCGVFRRRCLNVKCKELGIDKLALGFNLDDIAQSILMNLSRADMYKLARLAPHRKLQPGLIPRILPLRDVPEKETYLYAEIKGLNFYHGRCPYRGFAQRNTYREMIYKLEQKFPGTRHGILRSYELIAPMLKSKFPPVTLNPCAKCGEPTSQEVCRACELKQKLLTS